MATSDIGKAEFFNAKNRNTGEIEKKTLIPLPPSDGDLGGISEEELAQITTNKEGIALLKEDIVDVNDVIFDTTYQDINGNVGYFIGIDGKLQVDNSNNWRTSDFLSVDKKFSKIHLYGISITNDVSFYSSKDENSYISGVVGKGDGDEKSYDLSMPEIPSNAKYVRFCGLVQKNSNREFIVKVEEKEQTVVHESDLIVDKKVNANNIGFYIGTDGKKYDDGSNLYRTSDFLSINKYKVIMDTPNVVNAISFYSDKDENSYISGIIGESDAAGLKEYNYNIPLNAKYLRFCWLYRNDTECNITFKTEKYELVNNAMKGIYASFVGDSMMGVDTGKWIPYCIEKLGIVGYERIQTNGGVWSSGIAPKVININKNTDIIFIWATTNDWSGAVSELGDINSEPGVNGSCCSALKYAIEYISENIPKARIIMITPTQRFNNNGKADADGGVNSKGLCVNTNNNSLEDYVNAMVEIGDYYGIHVVDLYHNGGVNKFNYEEYYSDGIHQNENGGKHYANIIVNHAIMYY